MVEPELQLCIACSKQHSLSKVSCDCGHVMKEGLSLQPDNSRKRKAPYRPNSVSSEFIGKTFQHTIKSCAKKIKLDAFETRIKEHKSHLKKRSEDRKPKQKKTQDVNKMKQTIFDEKKREQVKEVLQLIENSYKNIYFNRCKSYKKVKLSDFDFEFDFSTFDSHNPYYPTALEDINTKITRTNAFKRVIEEC